MGKIKLLHKRAECIGCGLCVEVAPSYWYMDADGLASLHIKIGDDGPYEISECWSADMQILQEAEEGCPVKIIKVL